MKPLKFLRLLALPGLALFAASCDKNDEDNLPSKAAQLTAVTWRESSSSLVVNGVEGIQTVPVASADSYKFSSDGKVVVTEASGTATNGTWALTDNDNQVALTMGGQTQTLQVFTLSATNLSLGTSFTEAQVKASLAGQTVPGMPNGSISLLLLSAGGFTFPPNTPTLNANTITSLQVRTNMVPK
ncbi:lipocalin family protein [Hymenobacter norwichensis]|uniref:lipocalin family protein n=1 Tax=Hymenobacter norwichensis TaxID=223903 RepID=UPI0003B65710|nr:lipocalin family protein [Hymenobacter norwichensis]